MGKRGEGRAPATFARQTHRVTNPINSLRLTHAHWTKSASLENEKVPYFFFRSGMITASTADFCNLAK